MALLTPRRDPDTSGAPVSSVVVGWVRHRRHRPTVNTFRYRAYYVLLDLDERDGLDRDVVGLGIGRKAVTTFRNVDHFERDDRDVREKLRALLRREGIEPPEGRVQVLTGLRVLGHVFNPVSWWLCHDIQGTLRLVVAEVHNTFGDRHCYVLDDLRHSAAGTVVARARKAFHVSPFLPIEGLAYRFTIHVDDHRLAIHMTVEDKAGVVLDATQSGRRVPLSTASLWRALVSHPLLPLHSVVRIHLQAVRLWWRRVPFHRRPRPDGRSTPTVPDAHIGSRS